MRMHKSTQNLCHLELIFALAMRNQANQSQNETQGNLGFPGGAVVKNPPANAGDVGSSPDLGRSHMLRSN